MQARLVVLIGKQEGREIPLPTGQFIIGRNSACHLRSHSSLVSKVHCAIGRQSGHIVVRDLKSRNNTYLNDRRVTRSQRVVDGDVLAVGPLRFRFAIPTEANPVSAGRLTQQHLQWLFEDDGAEAVDFDGDTRVIEINEELSYNTDQAAAEVSQPLGDLETMSCSEVVISAGQYFRDYFKTGLRSDS